MLNVEYERVIDITARYLGKLDKAKPVANWAKEHMEKVQLVLAGYDQLISVLNSVPKDSLLLGVMPKTAKLKALLNGTNLPATYRMFEDNFALGLIEARGPMLHGQRIKHGEIAEPTSEDKSFAIGTTSMDITLASLAAGTIGHLCERTFFQWARRNDFVPEDGFKKDDWLKALDEGFMLMLARNEKPILFEHFLKSNENGGLGWLNSKKVDAFKIQAAPFLVKI